MCKKTCSQRLGLSTCCLATIIYAPTPDIWLGALAFGYGTLWRVEIVLHLWTQVLQDHYRTLRPPALCMALRYEILKETVIWQILPSSCNETGVLGMTICG